MKQETGETGDGRCETGDRRGWRQGGQGTGDKIYGRQERLETGVTGDRGDRRKEMGDRRLETGDRGDW